MIRVSVAGATGWTGQAVALAVHSAPDLVLTGAVARRTAGTDLGTAWGTEPLGLPITAEPSFDDVDVLVDYTSHLAVKANTLAAIEHGVHVVIGTSGLTAADFADIEAAAVAAGVGVVASGNFSVAAAMLNAASLLAARFLPQREIIDYASAAKADAPSGTSRELAERLGAVSAHPFAVPVADTHGSVEARGATIAGTQVHSLRLPSFLVSTEVVFAADDERLSIRHDAGSSPAPYVAGTLLAVRAVVDRVGLVRGLDTLLLES